MTFSIARCTPAMAVVLLIAGRQVRAGEPGRERPGARTMGHRAAATGRTLSNAKTKNQTPQLDHPLEEYQRSAHLPEFFSLLRNKNNWKDEGNNYEQANTVSRQLLNAADPMCAMDVPVTITPSKNVKKLLHRPDGQPATMPSDLDDSNGFVVARIINASNCATAPLKLDPGTYYWIVRRTPGSPDNNRQYESDFVSDVDGTTVQTARFTRCPHVNSAEHKNDHADSFAKGIVCNNELVNTLSLNPGGSDAFYESLAIARRRRPGAAAAGRPLVDPVDFTLWFTCELGCCYADSFVSRSGSR